MDFQFNPEIQFDNSKSQIDKSFNNDDYFFDNPQEHNPAEKVIPNKFEVNPQNEPPSSNTQCKDKENNCSKIKADISEEILEIKNNLEILNIGGKNLKEIEDSMIETMKDSISQMFSNIQCLSDTHFSKKMRRFSNISEKLITKERLETRELIKELEIAISMEQEREKFQEIYFEKLENLFENQTFQHFLSQNKENIFPSNFLDISDHEDDEMPNSKSNSQNLKRKRMQLINFSTEELCQKKLKLEESDDVIPLTYQQSLIQIIKREGEEWLWLVSKNESIVPSKMVAALDSIYTLKKFSIESGDLVFTSNVRYLAKSIAFAFFKNYIMFNGNSTSYPSQSNHKEKYVNLRYRPDQCLNKKEKGKENFRIDSLCYFHVSMTNFYIAACEDKIFLLEEVDKVLPKILFQEIFRLGNLQDVRRVQGSNICLLASSKGFFSFNFANFRLKRVEKGAFYSLDVIKDKGNDFLLALAEGNKVSILVLEFNSDEELHYTAISELYCQDNHFSNKIILSSDRNFVFALSDGNIRRFPINYKSENSKLDTSDSEVVFEGAIHMDTDFKREKLLIIDSDQNLKFLSITNS